MSGSRATAPAQLALAMNLNPAATFEVYRPGPNEAAVHQLRALVASCAQRTGPRQVFLFGTGGVGKSHLLQALCHAAGDEGVQAVLLPLRELAPAGAAVLEGLEALPLVCLDDVDAVAGTPAWEEGLFSLINACRQARGALVVTSGPGPASLPVVLPDLASRLVWGPVFQLNTLDDADKLMALEAHARQRGFSLPPESLRYLINRYPRDLRRLISVLGRLDEQSLVAQRRVTVPFIKSVLERGAG